MNEINRSVLICYTDMTEMNTTLTANGVLQFSFNTAIRGPSKFTQGFVFFSLLSFFLFHVFVADCCIFTGVILVCSVISPYT